MRAILKCSSAVGVQVFYPPSGTPRLYGRQDARHYGKATECANVNMNCHTGDGHPGQFDHGIDKSTPADLALDHQTQIQPMNKPKNINEFNRRDFLKTSLVASVAATTVGVATAAENTPAASSATSALKTETPSVISVTDAKPAAPLRKPWKNAIAVGRAYELLRDDVQSHLAILQRAIGYRYCRFHGLFHDEMAVVARRKDGTLAFRWHQVDKVFDALQRLGLRPFVELSTMPVALASGTATVFDWEFNTTPPSDYAEWGRLVEAFARHCLDRYGLEEIAQWYYEVWNEPNINFWTGSREDYWKL
jgi:xylan 1,4-beta-xylosidase